MPKNWNDQWIVGRLFNEINSTNSQGKYSSPNDGDE
jgi:hypothetical protein